MTKYEGEERRQAVPSPSNQGHRSTDDISIINAILDVRSKVMELVEPRLAEGTRRMDRIEVAQQKNNEDTAEILDIMRMARSFFKMTGYVGTFIKWGAGILAPVLAAWFAWKAGGKP